MNWSTPGLPVHHRLLESTQIHVHQVSDAIQPSYPLSSPSPLAPNPSQHRGLFQWVSPSHEVAKVLEFQLQHQSFQWTPKDKSPLGWTGWISCSPRDSQESSPTPQFKGSFPMSQFFTTGGQTIWTSASASVLQMNIQDWFPLGWTCWISLQSKGLSGVFSSTAVQKHRA